MLNVIGSLGLFLLGMWLMTEGLKLAGGRALEHLLGRWTKSRLRGLATGIGITALLQSSSAVTVACIGFVNAGLISFYQALWVVFGANVGTTFTAWIVTFFGFSLQIETYALPLVGIGAFLRTFAPQDRGRALGMALAGFGLLFIGIAGLKDNFASLADGAALGHWLAAVPFPSLMALLLGVVLTSLTQSSSAAIALILTALAGGLVNLEAAAACVIGANVGTTSTALLASIGATPNAKRLAWAHVIFNLLTAAVAFAFLSLFLWLVSEVALVTDLGQSPMVLLSVFHTCFNLLGLLLMWPLERQLSRWLLGLYTRGEPAQSAHLDTNVASVPDLAVRALALELTALQLGLRQLLQNHPERLPAAQLHSLLDRLAQADEFVAVALKSELAASHSQLLSAALSVSHHLRYAVRDLQELDAEFSHFDRLDQPLPEQLSHWTQQLRQWLSGHASLCTPASSQAFAQLQSDYRQLKNALLSNATRTRQSITLTDAALTLASLQRRAAEQLIQADEALGLLASANAGQAPTPEPAAETGAPL